MVTPEDVLQVVNDILAEVTILRDKGVALGIALSTDQLEQIAAKFNANLVDRGNVNVQIEEGASYTIERGYHPGGGVVAAVAGEGKYTLQEKSATPTKTQQNIVSDQGYYGLSEVTIFPIPSNYQDVSSVTAESGDVLSGKVIITSGGQTITGTMINRGAVALTMNPLTETEVTVPAGFHSGLGKITLTDDLYDALLSI